MSEPWLVFLHGINDDGQHDVWLDPLDAAMSLLGYQPFSRDRVVLPDYRAQLRGQSLETSLPSHPVTWTRPDAADGRQALARYLSTAAFLLSRLGATAHAQVPPVKLPEVGTVPPVGRIVEEARRYANDRNVRDNVHHVVLSELERIPAGSQVVILAHSLGSVVAVDVLKRLPGHLVVEALITFGSPLGAIKEFRGNHDLKDFPYDRVRAWVNVLEPRDIVTGGKGLSPHFPAAIDLPIKLPDPFIRGLLGQHGANYYCIHPCVASAITGVLVGQALVTTDTGPQRRPEGLELLLLQSTYLRELAKQLPTDRPDRAASFERARQLTATSHSAASAVLSQTSAGTSFLPPSAFLVRPHELIRGLWDDQTLLALAIMLATGLPAAPFHVEVKPDTEERKRALRETLERVRDVSAGGPTDEQMVDAIADARGRALSCLSSDQAKVLIPAVLVGAGVVTLAATGVGLALVAPAGLAGAALITSTLAAFGPGGMVGGMATLAALAGVGSAMTAAGTAIGVTSPGRATPNLLTTALDEVMASNDPEQLQALLLSLLTLVEAQETLEFPSQRSVVLYACGEAEARLAVRVHQHASIDPKSSAAKSARTMLESLRKACTCLRGEAGRTASALGAGSDEARQVTQFCSAFERALKGDPAALEAALARPELLPPTTPS